MNKIRIILSVFIPLVLVASMSSWIDESQKNEIENVSDKKIEVVVLKLKGFTSECCVGLVAYTLNNLEGVEKHEANVKKQEMKVWFDRNIISQEGIINEINKTHYKVIGVVE